MFQIATNWQLWDLPVSFNQAISRITLRGYKRDDPILLPAEFSHLKPLSVDDIASLYCPTRRDLFLLKKRRLRGSAMWGRIAGPLIEQFCKGLIDEYENLFTDGARQSYESLKKLIQSYSTQFVTGNARLINGLRRHSTSPTEDVTRFVLVLEYTGRYELAMLGADCFLNGDATGAGPLLKRVPLEHKSIEISPDARAIGISSPSKPDFLISSLQAVGDIKSGGAFKEFYPLTCAGYAMAYENHHGSGNDINFGLIYFVETHSRTVCAARSYAFVIDDELRREFLDRRNEAFGVLLRDAADPPPLASREQYCKFCKYFSECDQDR
ncbi:MAG: CRISPR-associated protein Cas4 [Dehalococcoidia bacterium]